MVSPRRWWCFSVLQFLLSSNDFWEDELRIPGIGLYKGKVCKTQQKNLGLLVSLEVFFFLLVATRAWNRQAKSGLVLGKGRNARDGRDPEREREGRARICIFGFGIVTREDRWLRPTGSWSRYQNEKFRFTHSKIGSNCLNCGDMS